MALDFTTFNAEDFVLNESFQAYATGSDAEAMRFWQQWLSQHPAQQPVAEQARLLVLALGQARTPEVPASQKLQDLQRLKRAISPPTVAPTLGVQHRRRVRVAALLLAFMLLLGVGYWLRPASPLFQRTIQYAASADKPRTVRLPDGSVVVLNGGSRLITAATWSAQDPREVWLEGEGYFQVSHVVQNSGTTIHQAPGNAKFVVHAGDLSVSVLGTRFNVISRPGVTSKVTLNSGKVLVESTGWLRRDEVLMQPGDLVESAPVGQALVIRKVKPAYYSAWVQGTLQFNHTSLPEIIRLIHDTHGLRLTIDDPRVMRQTITGSLPNTNADVLLTALAKSLGMRSERIGRQVRFRPLP